MKILEVLFLIFLIIFLFRNTYYKFMKTIKTNKLLDTSIEDNELKENLYFQIKKTESKYIIKNIIHFFDTNVFLLNDKKSLIEIESKFYITNLIKTPISYHSDELFLINFIKIYLNIEYKKEMVYKILRSGEYILIILENDNIFFVYNEEIYHFTNFAIFNKKDILFFYKNKKVKDTKYSHLKQYLI